MGSRWPVVPAMLIVWPLERRSAKTSENRINATVTTGAAGASRCKRGMEARNRNGPGYSKAAILPRRRSVRGRPSGRERHIFHPNAPEQKSRVESREDSRHDDLAENERQKRDFTHHDPIVRMPHEAIGTLADERCFRQRDDACRPIGAER